MGEAFGDPEELKVVVRRLRFEVETSPLAEVQRVAAEIDGDVPNMPREDADQFALGLTELVMQATKHAFNGEGLVILNESRRKTSAGEG